MKSESRDYKEVIQT